MKLRHFEELHPVCPVCASNGVHASLEIGHVAKQFQEKDDVIEGVLVCEHSKCLREYPIIDGIPIIVADIRSYIANSVTAIDARHDLTPFVESLLCDAAGPSSDYETRRQHLSSYCWDHYADLDESEPASEFSPGAVVTALNDGLNAAEPEAANPIIDVGCSVGRTTFELASRFPDSLVLGVDLNFSMLRVASKVLRSGIVSYPRRRVGMVYDRREFCVEFQNSQHVDFWACDATALPFRSETFALAVGLNVLDCVPAPLRLFQSIGDVLSPSGKCVLSSPYDWSPAATPVENWLGGHSQRSIARGDSASVIEQIFSSDTLMPLKLASSGDAPLWHVRLHDRSTMTYRNHRLVFEKAAVCPTVELATV
ncbi:MAG: methyltransferase domain-containing protein [Planctomycetales bacterium]|nr:methyltransferase domain-containing protein [Planctomycetales bacterium]